MELTITQLPISKIQLPARQLKEHPERQIAQIADSIRTYGFNDPIAVDENNEVIEGVGRVLAARKLKMKTVPAIRLEHLSEAQKRAYRIAHNKIAQNTGFDLEALRLEFEELCRLDDTLPSLTGFEAIELEELLKLPEVPKLGLELTETLGQGKTITCPHCGETIDV